MADQYCTSTVQLENVQVGVHGELSGRVKTNQQALYEELFEEMDGHFNNEQMITTLNHNPKQNEICVGKSGRDRRWYRVKVKDILSRKAGPQASCYLLDFGRVEMVPISCLYQIPSRFLSLPFQIHQFTLHSIQPLSMRISPENLHVSNRPVKSWDTAAVKFMSDRIQESTNFKAHVLGETADGVLSIRLYIQLRTRLECLNEVLVQQQFAMNRSLESEPAPRAVMVSKPRRTIKDECLKLSLRNNTDNKHKATVCHRDPDGIAYNSEPDLSSNLRGSVSDVGYTTDYQGLTIPHRRKTRDVAADSADKVVNNPTELEISRTSRATHSSVSSESEHGLSRNFTVSDVVTRDRPISGCKTNVQASLCRLQHQRDSDGAFMSRCSANSDDETMEASRTVSDISQSLAMKLRSPLSSRCTSVSDCESHGSGSASGPGVLESSPSPGRGTAFGVGRGCPPALGPGRGFGYLSPTTRPGSSSPSVVNTRSPAVRSLDKLLGGADIARPTSVCQCEIRVSDSEHSLGGMRHSLDGYSSSESSLGRGAVLKPFPNDHMMSISQKTNNISSATSSKHSLDGQFSNSDSDSLIPQRSTRSDRPICAASQPCSRELGGGNHGNRDYSSGSESAGRNVLVNSIHGEMEFKKSRLPKGAKSGTTGNRVVPKVSSMSPEKEAFNIHASGKALHAMTSSPSRDSAAKTKATHTYSRTVPNQPRPDNTRSRLGPNADPSPVTRSQQFEDVVPHAGDTWTVGASMSKTKDLMTRLKELSSQRGGGDAGDPSTVKTGDRPQTRPSCDPPPSRATISDKGSSSNDEVVVRPKVLTKTVGSVNRSTLMTNNLLGLQSGQKLLDQLLPSSRRLLEPSVSKTQRKDVKPGMYGVDDNVLVHGHRLTYKPIRTFVDAKFTDNVKKVWDSEEFVSPKLIQAYVWPVVCRGRHVVALSPVGSGKMFAYLFPLVSALLNDKAVYRGRPSGMGPLVVVLTASWRKAVSVYDEASRLVGHRSDLRVLLVHGGGQEDNKSFALVNGCDILVTTAPSLKRILAVRLTDLKRLCHLVIDDADDVLENFRPEVRKVMQEFVSVIDNNDRIPRQIMLFGSQWNMAIERFITCLNDPVVVVTSMFEAAIYGHVKQITHMCAKDQKLRELTGLLESLSSNQENRTIIFSSKTSDIIKLQQVLQKMSYYCMMVHKEMELFQVQHVLEQWNTNMQWLICCDEQITEMSISNATHVIHYDLPNSKTKFGNRFSTMRQYFQDFSNSHERKVVPTAHMIVGQDCTTEAKSIMELLKRSNSTVPILLESIYAGIQVGRQEDSEKPLCRRLLAYGICRNKWRCPDRHLVLPAIDHPPESNWIPDEGQVKVLVTFVEDASHYYVRLLSTKSEAGVSHDLTNVYASLQMDIGLWYSDYKHQIRHTAPCPGEVCGYQEKETFYRVQIVDILDMNSRDHAINGIGAEVNFVDSGREEQVPADRLYVLPEDLKVIPFQAVKVFVCRIQPMDKDTEWTHQSNMFIYDLLHGKALDGRVVLRLGYTLWLDPLVERLTSNTSEVRLTINRSYVHTEILRNELASENTKHLERLYRLCKGKVNVSRTLQKKTKAGLMMYTDVLPAVKAYHDVHVSSVAHPGLFYVQRKENIDELEALMAEINTVMARFELDEDEQTENKENFKVGKYVLAEYTSYDGRWYRGQILKLEEDSYEIFFADYGDRDSVRKEKVQLIPKEEFYDLPLQAIECNLAHIRPTGADWDDSAAGDIFWDLSHFINGDLEHFVAKVVSVEPAKFADRSRFVVEMVNRHSGEDLNLGQELVWRQLASPRGSGGLTDLFERPSHDKKFYKSPLEKVPEMCSILYWEQDPSAAVDLAQRLNNIVSHYLPSSASQCQDDDASCAMQDALVRLIGRVRWNKVHAIILDCVVILASASDRLCEELIQGEFLVYIVRCLSQNSDTKIQHQAADTMARIADCSRRFKSKLEDKWYLGMLQELFESTQCEQVQGAVCRALTALCAGSDSVYDRVVKMSISQKLSALLSQCTDHQVAESIILLLSTLATHDSSHADLKRECVIEAIIKNLDRTDCNQCINESIQLCDNYAAMRRKHKTFLLEQEMVMVLNSKLELEISATTRQLCKDLLSSLVVKVPSEPLAGFRIDSRTMPTSSSGVQPELHWSQNTFRTMLKVRVDNVPDTPDLVRFTENVIQFRVVLSGILHSFDYELYDKILPQKGHVKVTTSEVTISVEKVTKGKWPRLLHRKDKPANLYVDYENFVDSSDSEINDEDRPFVLKAKEKKNKMAGATGKASGGVDINLVAKSGSDTSDSLENADDYEERDRYEII